MDNKKKGALIGAGTLFTAIAVVGGSILNKKRKEKKEFKKLIQRTTYETGKIRKLGSLYLDGGKIICPLDLINYEDVTEYNGGKIEIKDTDKDDSYNLRWVEINHEGKKLLICDRNILSSISYDELNNQGLIFGKVVVIDNTRYLLRLLKGGDKKRDNEENEWNKYIVNVDNIPGLPVSNGFDTASGDKNKSEKLYGDNNTLWNWYDFCSLTQNECKDKCVVRGFYSNTYFNYVNKDVSYKTVGYRPVLEVIE